MLCCKIIKSQNNLKLKVRTEFPNVWGEYIYHGNPYIPGTTVPCDTSCLCKSIEVENKTDGKIAVFVYANYIHECTSKCMCMCVVTDNIHKQKCSKFPFPLYTHIFSVFTGIPILYVCTCGVQSCWPVEFPLVCRIGNENSIPLVTNSS